MARYEFGAGIADYVVTPSDGLWAVAPGAVITVWDAADGGTQYTDLQDMSGAAMTTVRADEFGFLPRFRGPDAVTGMWADAGGSSRAWVEAHNVTAGSASSQTSVDWLNVVRDFGAKGDGVTDDTAALQAAITAAGTAGGGTLYIPAGRYILTAALTWASGVTAIGAGPRASILQSTDQNKDCITGTDVGGITLERLQLSGPGRGFGSGVRLTRFSAPSTTSVSLRDVLIQSFGGDGIFCHQLASTILHRVRVRTCGGVGIHLQAPQDTVLGGASTSLIACSVEGCVTGGIWLEGMSYSNVNACAVQGAPFGYRLDTCTGVSLTSCGAEQCTTGMEVYGGKGVTVQGFVTKASDGTSVWLTNNAAGVVLAGVTEVSPGTGATTCLRTDTGTISTVLGLTAVKTNTLNGTVNRLDPGDGSVVLAGRSVVPSGGTAARMGTAVLAAGTVTVNTTAVTATSVIVLTIQTPGGTVGAPYVNARTAGTSFTIKSTSASDTSTVGWRILDPS
ncbi:right-handed parallel beta-helix repeat-containing protein [Streptomyces sp. 5-8]|uniref:Right-handed parallel beta-helix repeat-containing protein n=1 Tax=Streptomyces musisoli TaxID=2802280 RepID=A0ABS1P6I3_9ACTN|nr:right-handed parallel beta-helix repeat-containing protein [Streptomyces musisoli]MBL1107976.1 right-handed parallel beta-helix repeat-containing protein [Streptomyces musisoli]